MDPAAAPNISFCLLPLVDIPIVGIAPWAAIHGKSKLEGCKGHEVFVGASRSTSAEVEGRLNPHHTHFVLVDSGKEAPGAWGTEIDLRYRFEEFYATAKHVPIVQVVVQVVDLGSDSPRLEI